MEIGLRCFYFAISVTMVFLIFPCTSDCWRTDRRPKVYGDRLPENLLSPKLKFVQRKISAYHNFFRTKVNPPASNMLEMSWHPVAAKSAQKWSDACHLLTHDNATDRWTKLFGPCGQNIFVATHQVPWYFAIESWYLEYHNFTYGSPSNNLGVIGHYTQMVWATSHKVGCGYSKCKTAAGKTFYNYICNYCPTGNFMEGLATPYAKGEPCSDCPDSCNTKSKLCTNSCPVADLWMNCNDLNTAYHDWLCLDESRDGQDRRKHCRATCNCKDKIIPKFSFVQLFQNETAPTPTPIAIPSTNDTVPQN